MTLCGSDDPKDLSVGGLVKCKIHMMDLTVKICNKKAIHSCSSPPILCKLNVAKGAMTLDK